jgi:hypothetical protein
MKAIFLTIKFVTKKILEDIETLCAKAEDIHHHYIC